MEVRKKIAILGGGVTGVVVAGELAKDNTLFDVTLIEKSSVLGGLHRNFKKDGLNYDIGAFVLPTSHSLFKTFPEVKKICLQIKNNMGSVTLNGNIDKYPCTISGYIRDNGISGFASACLNTILCKFQHRDRSTLPSFIKYYIGADIYEKSGLRGYIERLYGMKDEEVDIEFATKRLSEIQKAASIKAIATKALRGRRTALVEPPTLKEVVVRPSEGFQKIYKTVEKTLIAQGVNLSLNCEMKSVNRKGEGFEIKFAEGTKEYYDRVISTIPIEAISRLIDQPLQKQLEYKKLLSLFYRFSGELGYDSNILHNFTNKSPWKRITTFSKYYGTYEGDEYFVVEITLGDEDKIDIEQQKQEFERYVQNLGLFQGQLKFQGSLIIGNAYPVYRRNCLQGVVDTKQSLQKWGLELAGRQGEFDYISSYDAAANAISLANKIKADYCN